MGWRMLLVTVTVACSNAVPPDPPAFAPEPRRDDGPEVVDTFLQTYHDRVDVLLVLDPGRAPPAGLLDGVQHLIEPLLQSAADWRLAVTSATRWPPGELRSIDDQAWLDPDTPDLARRFREMTLVGPSRSDAANRSLDAAYRALTAEGGFVREGSVVQVVLLAHRTDESWLAPEAWAAWFGDRGTVSTVGRAEAYEALVDRTGGLVVPTLDDVGWPELAAHLAGWRTRFPLDDLPVLDTISMAIRTPRGGMVEPAPAWEWPVLYYTSTANSVVFGGDRPVGGATVSVAYEPLRDTPVGEPR